MSEPYEEIIHGETLLRSAPGARHEAVCERLHGRVATAVARLGTVRLLPARSVAQLGPGTLVRPDLTLVTTATHKPWLVAEVVDSVDHRMDTVVKKSLYEDHRLPRLWMVDPRYDNVEVYHSSPYGLALKQILAGRELLQEGLLGSFELSMTELFGG